MKRHTVFTTIALVCVFILAIGSIVYYAKHNKTQAPIVVETGEEGVLAAYTEESWKTLIPETCQAFFDGCNTCSRVPGLSEVSCTEKYCTVYDKPKCLDQDNGPYTSESWKTLIDSSCKTFSDGCNTCSRMVDGGAACTRMMCETYARPECLDAKG